MNTETEDEVVDDLGSDIRAAFSSLEASGNEQPESAAETTPAKQSGEERTRDASGRFAPKQSTEQVPENPEPTPEASPVTQTPQTPAERAPVSWKPQLREKWAGVDPEVRAEIQRREREVDDALRLTAEARRFSQEFGQAIQPYMPLIQASNSTPIQAVQNLMQTASALHTGTPQNKAQLVAQLIGEYGVDIGMLSAALEGKSATTVPDTQVMQLLDRRLQPFQQFMQEVQTQRKQAHEHAQRSAQEELTVFMNSPENEYAQDVREEMADLLDVAARRGQKMSLQDAYARATLLHPQISQHVLQKRLQQQASQQTAAAERAKQASASVPNTGAPSRSDDSRDDGTLRSALQASIRSLSR